MPPQTPTPSTNPATKRRRIEAANATLRKPFRSPLVARQQQASGTGAGTEAGGEGSPTVTRSTAAGSEAAHPTTPEPGRYGLGGGGRSAGVDGGTNAGAGQVSPAGLKRKFANTKPKSAAASSSTTQREGVREGDDLLVQLYAAQKHLVSDVRAAETRLEVVRQARGIEEAMGSVVEGGDAREGREGGVDFGELVGRWKGASRLAADELFELIRGRVEGMGGANAWRETRRRQREGFHSDGEDGGGEKKSDEHRECEGDGGNQDGEAREDEEGESEESEFTMLMMLKSLNIDPDVLGYDAVEARWKD